MNLRAVALLALALPLAALAADPPYPEVARGKADVQAAMKQAQASQKRVIVNFGGNWCTDSLVLDTNLKKPENAELLQKHYVLVYVSVGDKATTDNIELAESFGVPLKKGVPALAVVEADGRVVHAQAIGEFSTMRRQDPKVVNDFLVQWAR